MTTLNEWLTLGRLALYIVVIIVMIRHMKQFKLHAEAFNWLIWAAHGSVYSIVFLLDYQDRIFDAVGYNYWASIVGIHGLIVLIAIYINKRTMGHGC